MRLLPLVALAVLSSVASADDWPNPEPVSFHSRGFGFVVEVFPPRSRQNPGDKALAYFYEVGYPGGKWQVDAKLRWRSELPTMPHEAVIAMDGSLVTLNAYGNLGYEHSVVVYDARGKVVRSLELADIVPEDDLEKYERSVSSRWWTRGAKYFFGGGKLYIQPAVGKTIAFSLRDGAPQYGAALPALDGNAAAEVWRTSLRFSSITDVLAARR